MVDIPSTPGIAETSEFTEKVPELQNGWRPTGGPPNPDADEGLLNWPLQALANRTRHNKDRLDLLGLKAASLVTVGPAGDYPTINEALATLSERRPAYVPGGFTTELRLLSGFVMREQVRVRSVNLSWITLTSEDAEVQIDRAYLTERTEPLSPYPAFSASDGGYLPVIGVLFTMMATGTATDRAGIHLYSNGGATVLPGCGVKNAGATGAMVNSGSRLAAGDAIFTGAGSINVFVGGGSAAALGSADLRNSGGMGLRVENGSNVSVGGALFIGCATGAITALYGSTVNAQQAAARCGGSDASSDVTVGSGSFVTLTSGTGGTSVTPNTLSVAGAIFK